MTWDPHVAAWFATNPWAPAKTPEPLQGHGIIYRLNVGNLVAAMFFYNEWLTSIGDPGLFQRPLEQAFVEDLRKIPESFALRPERQQAAVISGFDTLKFVSLVNLGPTIDAYVFPHKDDELARWSPRYPREHLIPPTDPFFDLKDEFDKKWAPHAQETYAVKYTHPVMVLTTAGPKFANLPDQAAGELAGVGINQEGVDRFTDVVDALNRREQLYESGMTLFGSDPAKAEEQFQTVIQLGGDRGRDRLTSLAHVRIAAIRLLRSDVAGSAEALNKSLDGPDVHPHQDWVGQLLQTIAQGATMLAKQGAGKTCSPAVEAARSNRPTGAAAAQCLRSGVGRGRGGRRD